MTGIYFVVGRIASYTPTSFTSNSFTNDIDLQEPLSVTLKNFIKANWPTNGLLSVNQIKFGNKWFDDFGSYQVHLLEPATNEYTPSNTTIGWQIKGILSQVDIHIFVRKNSLVQPTELDFIKRSIVSIIQLNRRDGPPIVMPNSAYMHVVREYDVVDKQPLSTLWHTVLETNINFWKASSN